MNTQKEEIMNRHKGRIDWVDALRGFAIILVFLGHVGTPAPLKIWLYSFHLPLFFFLSGYVFNVRDEEKFLGFLKRKIKRIIVPMIGFFLLIIAFNTLYYCLLLKSRSFKSQINLLIGVVIQGKSGAYLTLLWFLPCLFITSIILYIIIRIFKGRPVGILVSIISLFILAVIYIKCVGILCPWALETSLIVLLFMGVGYLLRCNPRIFECLTNRALFFLYLIINISITFFNYYVSEYNKVELVADEIGNPILFVIAALAGIMTFIVLFKIIGAVKGMSYIGKNSIIFYGLSELGVVIPNVIYYNIFNINPQAENLIVAVTYVIIQCLSIVPISWFINRYCKILLGKF